MAEDRSEKKKMNVQLLIAAEAEYFEILIYYDSQGRHLGDAFANAFRECVKRISMYPNAYPIVFKDIRKCRTNGFPYTLIYQIRNETAFVLAVSHDKRRPRWWKDRIIKS